MRQADDRIRRLQARIERERAARHEAERLLETKSLELYEANRALAALAAELEARVEQRTRELSVERRRALELAEVDALTRIANRGSFERQLAEMLAATTPDAERVALLLIDLDDFKVVNDSFGHAAGDALLVEVAGRLQRTVRPGDVVARLGGDEFAVIARTHPEGQAVPAIARRLLNALCRPVTLGDRSVPCSCSIGVAEQGRPGHGADELLRDADLALYAAKRTGRARVTAYESRMRDELERRMAYEAEVRDAVAADRIEPWFQPVMQPDAGRFTGAEVLARWHLADGEVRAPAAFLGVIETLGLLDLMAEQMLRRAFGEARRWVGAGSLEYLSVNVSPSQFNAGWTLQRLPAILAETGFPPGALFVEITETALLADFEATRSTLAALRATGMRIAVDDFGVGYSNLSLLRQLQLDAIKLDRTLICDIETDDHARAVVECILELAARLEVRVVAEGVETAGQAALLEAAGCAAMQGYWYARPQRRLEPWFARPVAVVPARAPNRA